MNKKTLRVLEYHKIIEQLTSHAFSAPAKERCAALAPMTDLHDIQQAQRETNDALNRIFQKGSLAFYGIHDIRPSIRRLEIESVLTAGELLALGSLLENANRIKAYSRSERTDAEAANDSLTDLFSAISPLTPLANEIRRCIISEEEMADDASPLLKQLRKKQKQTQEQIHTQLNSMVANPSTRSYLQDAVITMRNGRYCLPVKSEYRSQINGMIHDQSGSGSTLFIEPMAIVKLNNDIAELHSKEQEEIETILKILSLEAAAYTEQIRATFEAVTTLDFIFAKAVLAKEQNATVPQFNTEGRIRIRKGRHPLLDPKKVVPIDIRLGEEFDQLIITGPNTGGKTVSLKTVGLFTLMGQAGLHIPALDRSALSVFTDVFADIGDEQSIEQSLSTFSSHMTNIVHILRHADHRSLVLFDELCAGTDPTEGAALAMSILSHLHNRKVCTMATTHYSELKVFALTTPHIENACCEFDVATLSPTYRLLIGVPGKSNAFAISLKLGLPEPLIENARQHLSAQEESLEDLIADLETRRAAIERDQEEMNAHKKEIEALRAKLEQSQEKLSSRREQIIRDANSEARKILADAKAYADETIKKFQKYGAEGLSIREMEQNRSALRETMNTLDKAAQKHAPAARQRTHGKKEIEIGATVRVLTLNTTGTISTLPNTRGDLYVQMGPLRSQVNVKDIEVLAAPKPEPAAKKSTYGLGKAAAISAEINLIGDTVDEALPRLDKYLDDAYLAHLGQVRVVHGKGTGALKNAVHRHLKTLKYVKSFRLGVFGEGDTGVTIVEFKD